MTRSLRVSGAGLRLHALDYGGQGAPLVLLHGGSAHAHWWDFVAPNLADRFRVLALDLRGHGDSEWSREGAYRVADYGADLERWFDALGDLRPVLVGHSLGAFVALHHAVHHPRSLAALVLVDGRAAFGPSGSRYMKLLRMLAPAAYPSLGEAVDRFRTLPKETVATTAVLEHVARHGFRELADGRWVPKFDRASLGSQEPFDFRDRLGELACPVLFVRGEHSRVLSRDGATRFAAACREGSWCEIPGAHHHVLLDRPEALSREIREFLARNAVDSRGV